MPRSILFLALVSASLLLTSCGGEGGHGSGTAGGSGAAHSAGHGGNPASSHGGSASGHAATDLMDLLEVGGQRDPSRFVEIEIGTFRVTHKLAAERHTMLLKFRLFGIVPETKQKRLHEELPKFEKRIRDAVISLVQKTEVEQLAEPGLRFLKAELVAAINRVVQDRALHDVAFSDFSMEGV